MSVFELFYVKHTFGNILKNINSIKCLINENDWPHAHNQISKLYSNFENDEKKLQIFLKHDTLSQIKKNLMQIDNLIQFNYKQAALEKLQSLNLICQKTIDDSIPVIYNIL